MLNWGQRITKLAVLFAIIPIVGMSQTLLIVDPAEAQTTACPVGTILKLKNRIPALFGTIRTLPVCLSAHLSANDYDNLRIIDITPAGRFIIAYPDKLPRPSASEPVRAIFSRSGGTNRVPINNATCKTGTITGVNTTLVEISLPDDTSCALTLSAPSGPGGTIVAYQATLSRAEDVYFVSAGTLAGGIFGGVYAPEIDVTKNGVSISTGD